MARIHAYHNARCLKCKECTQVMLRVGPMIFCNECFISEFGELYTLHIDSNSEVYQKWIKIYKEK
jgi:hypothetical protein